MNESEQHITEPFDPSKIDVDIATINLGLLIDQLANKEIELAPDFQRASDIWNKTKKSRLIESILLGLPLPSFYFCQDSLSDKLVIIDGLQRLCALRDFVLNKEKPLRLESLQFLKSYEGKCYDDLERPDIRRISGLKITVNTLRRATPDRVKYILFQRVNTAGEPLKQQEMRHALNQGRAADFIKELAEEDAFRQATCYSVRSKRMEDRDFANRFVAFYLGQDEYSGDLDAFMNEKMSFLNRTSLDNLKQIKSAFIESMKCCYTLFGDDTFRRRKNLMDKRRPISKAVFDSLSVNIAWLSQNDREKLISKSDSFRTNMRELFNNDKFDNAISTGTATRHSVTIRFNMIKETIKKTLSYDTTINN